MYLLCLLNTLPVTILSVESNQNVESKVNNVESKTENWGVHKYHFYCLKTLNTAVQVHQPMLKSVCAVHSSSLAFKDVCKCVPQVKHLITQLSSIASHFHTSARRTAELRQIAASNGFTIKHLPTYFEVRWAEFSESLLGAVLQSWRALAAYFSSKCAAGDPAQFKKSMTNSDNIKFMCFLADLLFLLANFQKKLQSDLLTILDIKPELDIF